MRNKKKCFFGMLVLVLLFVSRLAFALDFVYVAKLERIIDGDTIVADLYLGLNVILDDQYIRLYGIDAWETRGEEREKGLEAKEYLEERLSKGNIEIEIRPEWGQNGKGKYGRWLGIIYIDGVNINDDLMEKGHAEKYEGDLDDTERSTRMSNIWGVLTVVVAVATPFVISIAAYIALKGVRATRDAAEATRKATEGQLFMQIMATYTSEKMLRAMRKLIGLKKEHKGNYAIVFGERLKNDYPRIRGWDEARRRFSHWRFTVRMLRKHNFISKNLFRALWGKNPWKFYKRYIKPLEIEVGREMEEREAAANEKTDEKKG